MSSMLNNIHNMLKDLEKKIIFIFSSHVWDVEMTSGTMGVLSNAKKMLRMLGNIGKMLEDVESECDGGVV